MTYYHYYHHHDHDHYQFDYHYRYHDDYCYCYCYCYRYHHDYHSYWDPLIWLRRLWLRSPVTSSRDLLVAEAGQWHLRLCRKNPEEVRGPGLLRVPGLLSRLSGLASGFGFGCPVICFADGWLILRAAQVDPLVSNENHLFQMWFRFKAV